jgi:Isochorismatase family
VNALREGSRVAFVADACGSATALGHDISLRRMEQQGVALTTTASVSAELAGGYSKHAQIMHG